MSSRVSQTAAQWYQTKRIPLYIVVGSTVAAAVAFLRNRATHTETEGSPAARRNELQEVDPAGAHSKAVSERATAGASSQGSAMRGALRKSGMMEGQTTDGIFPNTAIAKKLGEVMGPQHPPLPETEQHKGEA